MNGTHKPHLPAASGYAQLASVMNLPTYKAGFLQQFYAQTITGQITDHNIIPKEMLREGDEVVFRIPPKAKIYEYHKNQELEVDQLETATISMYIGRAFYSNLKLDRVDEKQLKDAAMFIKAYQDSVKEQGAQRIDREILQELPFEAHNCNKGRAAGRRSRAIDLGAANAPVKLTAKNLPQYLSYMRSVLAEQDVPTDNLYVVFPTAAMNLFYMNPILANACASGQDKSIIMGDKIPNILGFDVYFSNNMPTYRDPSGVDAYTIIAGRKDATGMVTQLSLTEFIDKDTRSFAKYWRSLMVYDFKVLQPEFLSVLYATLDLTTMP